MLIYEATMSELPPLPEPDGSAEVKTAEFLDGSYVATEVDAWSEPLVRAYAAAAVAAERERQSRDAARYRWLRDNEAKDLVIAEYDSDMGYMQLRQDTAADVDAYIDEAIALPRLPRNGNEY